MIGFSTTGKKYHEEICLNIYIQDVIKYLRLSTVNIAEKKPHNDIGIKVVTLWFQYQFSLTFDIMLIISVFWVQIWN